MADRALADRLVLSLQNAGLSMRAVYKALSAPGQLGTSYAAVQRYCTAATEPSVPFVVAVAKMTGVSVVWLATGEGEPYGQEDEARLVDGRIRAAAGYLARVALDLHADAARAVLLSPDDA